MPRESEVPELSESSISTTGRDRSSGPSTWRQATASLGRSRTASPVYRPLPKSTHALSRGWPV